MYWISVTEPKVQPLINCEAKKGGVFVSWQVIKFFLSSLIEVGSVCS